MYSRTAMELISMLLLLFYEYETIQFNRTSICYEVLEFAVKCTQGSLTTAKCKDGFHPPQKAIPSHPFL
jgi:hypothetical protein